MRLDRLSAAKPIGCAACGNALDGFRVARRRRIRAFTPVFEPVNESPLAHSRGRGNPDFAKNTGLWLGKVRVPASAGTNGGNFFTGSFAGYAVNALMRLNPSLRSPHRDGRNKSGHDNRQAFASACSRILLRVVAGVIASGSIFTWMMDGLPDVRAAVNASAKSAVRSTVAPNPPKARA